MKKLKFVLPLLSSLWLSQNLHAVEKTKSSKNSKLSFEVDLDKIAESNPAFLISEADEKALKA